MALAEFPLHSLVVDTQVLAQLPLHMLETLMVGVGSPMVAS